MSGHGWTPERLDLLPVGTVIETCYGESLPSFLEVKYVEGRWATGESNATSRDIADDAISIEVHSLPLEALQSDQALIAGVSALTMPSLSASFAVAAVLKCAIDSVPGVTP